MDEELEIFTIESRQRLRELLIKMLAESYLVNSRRNVGKRLPVLCYHRVLPDLNEYAGRVYSVSPNQFESQMVFLKENNFQSLSLEEYREMALGHKPVGARCVLVTLDDGYADSLHVAWPIAQRHEIKINLFILTEYIGKPDPIILGQTSSGIQTHMLRYPHLWRQLTWDQLLNLRESGVGIGLHGHSHRNVINMGVQAFELEIAMAIKIYQNHLKKLPSCYSFPYGSYKTFTTRHIDLLKRYDLDVIFSTLNGRTILPCKRPPCSRLVVNEKDSIDNFRLKLLGAYDFLGTIRWGQYWLLERSGQIFSRSISTVF